MKTAGIAFLTLLLLINGFVAASAKELVTAYGIRLVFEPDNPDFTAIRDYLRLLDRITARMVMQKEDEQRETNCRLMPIGIEPEDQLELTRIRNVTVVRLPAAAKHWNTDRLLRRRVVAILLLVKCGITPQNLEEVDRIPTWLTTGAIGMATFIQDGELSAKKNYFELRALDSAGFGMSLDDIVMGDYVPECGVFYDLFAEGSEYLLSLCMGATSYRDNFIRELVIRSYYRKKETSWDVFFATAGESLNRKLAKNTVQGDAVSPRERVRTWFRNGLRTRNINFFYPQTANNIRREFDELRTVKLTVVNPKGEMKVVFCKIEDVAASVRQTLNAEGTMNQIMGGLTRLQNECPGELLPPLTRMFSEANAFRNAIAENRNIAESKNPDKKTRTEEEWKQLESAYQTNVAAAIADFEEMVRQRTAVENYLRAQEKFFLPPEVHFYFRLKSLDDMDRMNRKLWPEINNYLDQLEKEYVRD